MRNVIALILLCAGISYGQTNPQGVASSYRDFSGGLNNFSAPISLAPNESPNLQNVVIDEPQGALTQRKGYMACGNTPSGATATSLYEYSKNDGSRRLIVSDNNTIWQTGDCISYSTIATNLGSLNLPRFATIQDNLWIVNGSTYPIVWNGTTGYYLDGASSRPLGPKGKLITYWKSRVWIGNTTQSPSGLYFSALVDAQGNIMDPAVSTNAWSNALNLIYFNRDNGSPLYGIKVYRDNLYAFKENDILRLVFESEYTSSGITVTKTVSKTGSKFQESIVEMDDGLLRFVGRDGVYAFDGSMVKRISTKWTPTFYTIKQPTHGEQYALWDSAADWSAGFNTLNISTNIVAGSVILAYSTNCVADNFSDNNFTDNPVWTETPYTGVFTAANGYLQMKSPIGYGYIQTYSTQAYGAWDYDFLKSTDTNHPAFRFMTNVATGNGYSVQFNYAGVIGGIGLNRDGTGGGNLCYFNSGYTTGIWTHINITRSATGVFVVTSPTGNCTATDNTYTTGGYAQAALAFGDAIDNIHGPYSPNGIYTSQISTASALTLWKTFDVDQTNVSSTSISYQVRVASTIYNLGLASYASIVPGSIVSASTNTYYQWKANLATTDNGVTPALNSASVGWVTGDSSKSPLTALAYKSRYWLAVSTGLTNSYNDMTMVESKSPLMTYTKYDLPLSAMTLWNDNLYGAIGNTSKIVRVDYGSTDAGAAITAYWDSRDDVYDNPINYKSINRIIADYSSTPANSGVKIGLSADFGGTWQYQTVNTNNNPTLPRNTSIINMNANNALQFRTRIMNSTPGIGFTFYGIHGLGSYTNFIGN